MRWMPSNAVATTAVPNAHVASIVSLRHSTSIRLDQTVDCLSIFDLFVPSSGSLKISQRYLPVNKFTDTHSSIAESGVFCTGNGTSILAVPIIRIIRNNAKSITDGSNFTSPCNLFDSSPREQRMAVPCESETN